jgi:purine-binding chemotaxis protein CheW
MFDAILENRIADGSLAGKYLTFTLGQEFYCIAVLKVREIIRFTRIATVPGMAAHICGVVNLRGKIIPVMDLRLRLGVPCAEATVLSSIMVVQIQPFVGKSSPIGMVVDSMEEVVNIGAADLEPAPEVGTAISTECILGIARIKGVVKTLLDIDGIAAGSLRSPTSPAALLLAA